jgi:hypothetical protein
MDKFALIKAILNSEEGANTDNAADLSNGSKFKIVILQRGWIFVGRFKQEGTKCTLTDAKNIRCWGTTKGLGELAESGPTTSTKLDAVNDVSFHVLTAIATIDCDYKVWAKV